MNVLLLLACSTPPPSQGPAAPSPAPEAAQPAAMPAAPKVPQDPAPVEPAPPSFEAVASPLPEALIAKMTGVSWKPGCPVPLEDLALLKVSHWDFEGTVQQGELVIAAEHTRIYTDVFRKAFEARAPIERMQPVHHYGGDDDASMKANNTSAFNCRQKTTSKSFSEHSYGHAIDINPLINPFVTGSGRVYPAEGAEYADRSKDFPGKIDAEHVFVKAFAAHGWKWGGNWEKSKDYQHFSLTGK